MGDASCSNGTEKISNGWCQLFEWLTNNFEWKTPAVRTANEKLGTAGENFEWMMPAIRMANEKFQIGDARHSNC